MKAQLKRNSGTKNQAPERTAQTAALRAQFEALRQQLSTLDWLTEGSVSEGRPGAWRWTRKVKAKTVTVTLSPVQAEAFRVGIANHRQLEKLILEMRALSQAYLLECLPGPTRRRPRPSIPNHP